MHLGTQLIHNHTRHILKSSLLIRVVTNTHNITAEHMSWEMLGAVRQLSHISIVHTVIKTEMN